MHRASDRTSDISMPPKKTPQQHLPHHTSFCMPCTSYCLWLWVGAAAPAFAFANVASVCLIVSIFCSQCQEKLYYWQAHPPPPPPGGRRGQTPPYISHVPSPSPCKPCTMLRLYSLEMDLSLLSACFCMCICSIRSLWCAVQANGKER